MTPEQFQAWATGWLNAFAAVLPQAGAVVVVAVGVVAGIWAAIKTKFQQKQLDSNTKRLDDHDSKLETIAQTPPAQTTILNQPTVIEQPAPAEPDPDKTEPGTPPIPSVAKP